MSRQFGIPVAGWGVVYFVTLASLLILGHILGASFDPEAALGAQALAFAGACGSIVLAVIIATGIAPFCPLCMAIHVINLGLVLAIWRFSGRTAGQTILAIVAAGRYLLGRSIESGSRTKWTCVGFLTTALIAVVLYQCLLFQMQVRIVPKEAFDAKQVLIEYAFTPEEEIPFDSSDPQIGDGPVQLVMFSSFECPACKIVCEYLRQAIDRYKGKLKIIFKHFPLGTACNPQVKQDQYPHACAAALAAEAAKHENAFWAFHDALLTADLSEPNDPIARVAQETGLTLARFDELRKAEITKKKLQKDIELGIRLGVVGTPTIFINGRRLKHYSLQAIDLIIAAVTNAPQIEVAHLD
jgi:protein-disulfide isomerase